MLNPCGRGVPVRDRIAGMLTGMRHVVWNREPAKGNSSHGPRHPACPHEAVSLAALRRFSGETCWLCVMLSIRLNSNRARAPPGPMLKSGAAGITATSICRVIFSCRYVTLCVVKLLTATMSFDRGTDVRAATPPQTRFRYQPASGPLTVR